MIVRPYKLGDGEQVDRLVESNTHGLDLARDLMVVCENGERITGVVGGRPVFWANTFALEGGALRRQRGAELMRGGLAFLVSHGHRDIVFALNRENQAMKEFVLELGDRVARQEDTEWFWLRLP